MAGKLVLSTKGVAQGSVASPPPESLVEMQNLGSHLRDPEPESALKQDPLPWQFSHTKVLKIFGD